MAKGIGVSASHLTALFHRQMGISPGEYIRRVKLEESKGLIREGKMNFSQIAAALHYSTIHHFSRQFKENSAFHPRNMQNPFRPATTDCWKKEKTGPHRARENT